MLNVIVVKTLEEKNTPRYSSIQLPVFHILLHYTVFRWFFKKKKNMNSLNGVLEYIELTRWRLNVNFPACWSGGGGSVIGGKWFSALISTSMNEKYLQSKEMFYYLFIAFIYCSLDGSNSVTVCFFVIPFFFSSSLQFSFIERSVQYSRISAYPRTKLIFLLHTAKFER